MLRAKSSISPDFVYEVINDFDQLINEKYYESIYSGKYFKIVDTELPISPFNITYKIYGKDFSQFYINDSREELHTINVIFTKIYEFKIFVIGSNKKEVLGNVAKIIFERCKFKDIKSKHFFVSYALQDKIYKIIQLENCIIENLDIENRFSSLPLKGDTEIDNLIFSSTEPCELKDRDLLSLTINNAGGINLRNLNLCLINIPKLNQIELLAENITINFNWNYLKRLKLSENEYAGYYNTFRYLYDKEYMKYNMLEIEKYINYFKSRKRNFEKTLFWFNKGYTDLRKPFYFAVLFLIINVLILYFGLNQGNKTLIQIFYPVSYFREVFFADFILTFDYRYFSIYKIISLLIESGFLFSSISWIIAIKKVLGFKIN